MRSPKVDDLVSEHIYILQNYIPVKRKRCFDVVSCRCHIETPFERKEIEIERKTNSYQRFSALWRGIEIMIKVLFICHDTPVLL